MRLFLIAAVFVSSLIAQAPTVMSPDEFFGRPLGATFTRHDEVMSYVRAVDAASDRIGVESYGTTTEGRPLTLVIATSSANSARLPAIKDGLRKLGDPRIDPAQRDVAAMIADLPCVVWLSFNVHGNEASGTEAFLAVLHRLASDGGDDVASWLAHAVIILDPCLNPDGHDRYVNWYRSVAGSVPDVDRATFEHAEPWPTGRFNHWNFDLNRDWAFASQPETRARLPKFTAWSPQVHVDVHEMDPDSTYFFFPANRPINSNFPPMTVKWGKIFGEGNAAAFDAVGAPYFTAEDYDLFYPGYGDSWPSLNGAIGMTYEMAGNGRAGVAMRRDDGRVLTLLERLRHHERATLSTVATAVKRRDELLRDWHDFRRTAVEEGRGGAVRAFILDTETDPQRADALAANLRLQGIEVQRSKIAWTLPRVKDVYGAEVVDRTFPAGTYFVSLDQPLKRLAKTLLEPRTDIRELYFYDVSAWSQPLAFGVPCFEVSQPLTVDAEQVGDVVPRPGTLAEGPSPVGWLLDASNSGSVGALASLLRAGVLVRCAQKTFTHSGQVYSRGAFLVRRNENSSEIEAAIKSAVAAGGFVRPVASGLSQKGIDLGSASFPSLNQPRVLLVAGRGRDATSFGAARFLLDQIHRIPYSVVTEESLTRRNLARATAVVFTEGRGITNVDTRTALREFMSDGGVVVAMGSSAFGSLGKDSLSDVKAFNPERKAASRPVRLTEEREEQDRKRQAPGSIFRVELDPAQPLAFGYRGELTAFKSGLSAFDPSGPGTHVGWFADAPPIAGYVNDDDEKQLRGKSYLTVSSVGDGALVLFAEDPNFRGGWHGLSRLFLNSILILPKRSAS